jgi:hypothetical protein
MLRTSTVSPDGLVVLSTVRREASNAHSLVQVSTMQYEVKLAANSILLVNSR